MFEKVNPSHPDKVADRIAGAIVDLGYKTKENPKIACEVLIGHGNCHIIIETDVNYDIQAIHDIVKRITKQDLNIDLQIVPQDTHLADNQKESVRCGDNGIFKGIRISEEEIKLTNIVKELYQENSTDGKYIYDESKKLLIACQSNESSENLKNKLSRYNIPNIIVNPLGDWTGGTDVDTGATNRKLGSDMGRAVTGGGLHGKDISKADISINIYLHLLTRISPYNDIECNVAIGDNNVSIMGKEIPYSTIVKESLAYIQEIGGFEKLAEWGLIR